MVFQLSKATISNFLNSYFKNSGIEYNVIRVPLAGVDFSNRTYTYDETDGDFNLTNFSLSHEDFNYKIPLIQTALKLTSKQMKIFASAWTAPPWMKTNKDYKGNGYFIFLLYLKK